jgi:hypothetical protein
MDQGGGCNFGGTGLSGWTFKTCLDATTAIAKKVILQSGGAYANGAYTIPVQDIPPVCTFEKYGQAPASITCTIPGEVGVASPADRLTLKFVSSGGPGLCVRFTIPEEAAGKSMSIELLDLRGRLVCTCVKGAFGAGDHVVAIPSRHLGVRMHGRYLARIKGGIPDKTAPVMLAM